MQTRDPSVVNRGKGRGREKDLVRSIVGMKYLITATKDRTLIAKGEKGGNFSIRRPIDRRFRASPADLSERKTEPPPALPPSFGPQKPVPTTAPSDSQRGVEQPWALAFLEDVRREINWLFYELPGVARETGRTGPNPKKLPVPAPPGGFVR